MSSLLRRKRNGDVDMTEGSILRHLVMFALPLLAGNLFQQLYNMVDTWVIGNFGTGEAYAAVGSVGPITNTLIGFFTGLSTGASVVISQKFGARDYEDVSKAVHSAMIMTLILDLIFTVVGICMTPFMLDLMKMPESAKDDATLYLRIYFSGLTGLMFYNIGSGILRAVGDSKHPFYFLVVSASVNIVLDLLFVKSFGMGVVGVALATVIAQLISAAAVVFTLLRTDSCVKLSPKKLRIHPKLLLRILAVGTPAGIQMALTAFSNVFVQSYINHFDTDCMGGWTTYAKVDQLLFLPMQSLALAVTTFVGQNLGKLQVQRAKRGTRTALALAFGITILLMIPVIAFADRIVLFFNPKSQGMADYAALFLRWLTPFYLFSCINQTLAGSLRGAGDSRAPMLIMLTAFVGFRQLYLFTMSRLCNEVIPIAMGYPAGWALCCLLIVTYYRTIHNRRMKKLTV